MRTISPGTVKRYLYLSDYKLELAALFLHLVGSRDMKFRGKMTAEQSTAKIDDRLLSDLKGYLLGRDGAVLFACIVRDFRKHPLTLVAALCELEKENFIRWTFRHNALTVER
jgi:hypothetical protein